jgi:signal peptidase I
VSVAASNRPASAGSSASSKNVVANARAGRASKRPPTGGSGGGRKSRSVLWDNVRAFLGTVLIFLVIRAFLVEAFRIPSGSMIPSLLVGDWLFVNKLVYGPHIPFTETSLPGYSDPKRGDVVVFKSPYQADEASRGLDPTPTLVKRLVGLPGDTVHMRGGLLHVNGIPQPQGYGAPAADAAQDYVDPLFEWQKAIGLRASRFGAAPAEPSHDNWGPLVVPAAHYMMLGDNRYCSKDGRYWGFVPRGNLRGRPIFVYYSYRAADGSSELCNPDQSDDALPFLTDIRWGRIGHRIK